MAAEEITLKVVNGGSGVFESSTGASTKQQKDTSQIADNISVLKKAFIGGLIGHSLIKSSQLMQANTELMKKSFYLGLRPIGNILGKAMLPYTIGFYKEMLLLNKQFETVSNALEKEEKKSEEKYFNDLITAQEQIATNLAEIPSVITSLLDVKTVLDTNEKNQKIRDNLLKSTVESNLQPALKAFETVQENKSFWTSLIGGAQRVINGGAPGNMGYNRSELTDIFKTQFQKTSKETMITDKGFVFQKPINMDAANIDLKMDTGAGFWDIFKDPSTEMKLKIETLKQYNDFIGGVYGDDAVIKHFEANNKEYNNHVKRIYSSELSNAEKDATKIAYDSYIKSIYNEQIQNELREITGNDYATFFDEITGQPKQVMQKYFSGKTTLEYTANEISTIVGKAKKDLTSFAAILRASLSRGPVSSGGMSSPGGIQTPGGKFVGFTLPKKVNDLILTKDGRSFETSPQDNIIATKGGAGGSINTMNININVEEINSEIQLRELANKIATYTQRQLSYKTGGY